MNSNQKQGIRVSSLIAPIATGVIGFAFGYLLSDLRPLMLTSPPKPATATAATGNSAPRDNADETQGPAPAATGSTGATGEAPAKPN
ncbi:MAG: hypothetical protein IBJ11_12140 [Phycisphaerales bacterium]|nr:hypothetical protein [Phycisphaerales bacterium]